VFVNHYIGSEGRYSPFPNITPACVDSSDRFQDSDLVPLAGGLLSDRRSVHTGPYAFTWIKLSPLSVTLSSEGSPRMLLQSRLDTTFLEKESG